MSILPDFDGGTLGQDMMFEIFLRSSMESLKRLCFISRNWETFLSLPYFNKLYYERNPRNQCLSLPTSQNKVVFLEKSSPLTFSAQELPLECKEMNMVGSCEGVIAFINRKRCFLWNPLNKLGKMIPIPPTMSHQRFSSGLAYNSSRFDYKMVILVQSSSTESQLKMYSSSNDIWRDLCTARFSVNSNSNSKFTLNGCPYWVGEGEEGKVVFRFDPTSETYDMISFPVLDESRTFYVARIGDEVGGLAYSLDHIIDVFFYQGERWVRYIAGVVIGPIDNNFPVTTIQYFKQMIIFWGSPSEMRFYYTTGEPLLTYPPQLKVDESYCHLNSMVRVSGSTCYYPTSVGEIFRDYMGRRGSLITALTSESKMFCRLCKFYQNCFPGSAIRLYGLPNEWKVRETSSELHPRHGPRQLPEPLSISLASSSMVGNTLLYSVARSCDHWLVAVAFHMAASYGFDKADRKRLFLLINDLPTVYEVVRQTCQKQSKEETSLLDN